VQGLRLVLGLALVLLVLLASVETVAQQQVTITYVVLNVRSLYGTVPAGTTYEMWIPLPKSMWSTCSDFQLFTPTGVAIPAWVFECYDGDSGVPIHNVQLQYTTSTPPSGWDTNPYFNDADWTRYWGGAGYDSDYNIDHHRAESTFYAMRYIVDLPLKPSRAVLHVRVGQAYSGVTTTINGCQLSGGNCLIRVNGNPVGSAVTFSANRYSYDFDVTSLVQAGPNLITTTASLSSSHVIPRFGIKITAYYNGYWVARAYVRLPFDLTTTPTSVIVLPFKAANVKNPNAFLFFDDFDTWNPASYTVSGLSTSVSNGKLTITTTSSGSLQLAQTFNAPFAFIAKIDSNVQQSSASTRVHFGWDTTNFASININAGSTAPNHVQGRIVYNGAWPWLVGYTMTDTLASVMVGQRYSAVFTTVSSLSMSSNHVTSRPSAGKPTLVLSTSPSGYTVGITLDWIAVFRPPADLRNPVYTAEVRTVTVSFAKIVLPGQPAANVLAYTFNATIYGGDMYNSGVLVGQGLMAVNATTMLETYNVVSFPARSTLAIQLKYNGAFEANLAYVDPASGYTNILERLSYNGSVMTLTRGETLVLQVTPPASNGYVQLEIFGSERRVYVYTSSGTKSARGSSDLVNVNAVLYRGVAPLNIIVMEGLLVTFTQNGLLAVSIKGVDAMDRSIDIFVGDARSPTATGVDLDVTPEIITVGVPLGVYPVKATVTAYLDAQAIQYSLIVPQIPLQTVVLTPGAPATTPGGSLMAVLARSLAALDSVVPAEHRPLVALTSVMILATLATLTTAPLFTVLATVALLAFATAGWVSAPTALLAVLIVVGLALARRYTR
jgi:hypothetical protein